MVAVGAAAITNHVAVEEKPLPDTYEKTYAPILRKVRESKGSLVYTLGESVLFTFAQHIIGNGLDAADVPTGGHAYTQDHALDEAERNAVWDTCKKNAVIPLIEEAIFRLIPAAITDDDDMAWAHGMTANVFFSLIHNFDQDENGDYLAYYASVPALQFILGSYCWYLMKTRGFSHAVAAHCVYNMLIERCGDVIDCMRGKSTEPTQKRAGEDGIGKIDENK